MVLIVAVYTGFAVPLIPIGTEDIRMADVFSADEALAAAVVRHLHSNQTIVLETFSYGGLSYYLPLMVISAWGSLVGGVSDQVVILVMRSLCTLAGFGCLWLTYCVGRLAFGQTVGIIAAFLLVSTPVFLRWSVEIHPDLPQLFWLLCALYWCARLCQSVNFRSAIYASLFSGLAFGTKYSGLFVLPVIGMIMVFVDSSGRLAIRNAIWRLREPRTALGLALIATVFALSFLATNPYAFLNFQEFQRDVSFERSHLSFGHTLQADHAGLNWLLDLFGVSGMVNGAFFLIGVCMALFRTRLGLGKISTIQVMFAIWIGIYVGYLVLAANFRAPRHLMPVLPFVLLFAADSYDKGWNWIFDRWGKTAGAFAIIGLLAFSAGHFKQSISLFQQKANRVDDHSEIAAGLWISENFEATSSVLFDAYSYVPSKFSRVYRSFGQSYSMVT